MAQVNQKSRVHKGKASSIFGNDQLHPSQMRKTGQSFDNGLNEYIKTGSKAINSKNYKQQQRNLVDKGQFGDRYTKNFAQRP